MPGCVSNAIVYYIGIPACDGMQDNNYYIE